MKIEDLRNYLQDYTSQNKVEFPVSDFVEYVRIEEASKKKGGVVSLEDREASQRLKSIKEFQEENKDIDPAEDIKNL